jgi:hypothetical protein
MRPLSATGYCHLGRDRLRNGRTDWRLGAPEAAWPELTQVSAMDDVAKA